jgi:hypothetical protein
MSDNRAESRKNSLRSVHGDKRLGRPATSRTGVNAAQVEGPVSGNRRFDIGRGR